MQHKRELNWFSFYWITPVVFVLLTLTSAVYAHDPIETTEKTLVIGKVSTNPKKHFKYLRPISDYVVERMADLGYTDAKVLMAKDVHQLARYMRLGKVDWVTESPFSSVILKRKANAEYLLRKWKKGVPNYHSIIFVRRDSGISNYDDLKGRVIAFQDRGSSTSFYLPAHMLISKGYKLVEMSTYRDKPPKNAIGYIFAKEEINISTWVHKGIVAAGAYSNLDWYKDDHNPPAFRDIFMQIAQSEEIPRAIETVRSDLPTEVKARLKSILLEMESLPQAQTVLDSYQATKKFDPVTDEIQNELKLIGDVIRTVDAELD
jgi:phosphonate transport system substrate-binding protein